MDVRINNMGVMTLSTHDLLEEYALKYVIQDLTPNRVVVHAYDDSEMQSVLSANPTWGTGSNLGTNVRGVISEDGTFNLHPDSGMESYALTKWWEDYNAGNVIVVLLTTEEKEKAHKAGMSMNVPINRSIGVGADAAKTTWADSSQDIVNSLARSTLANIGETVPGPVMVTRNLLEPQ